MAKAKKNGPVILCVDDDRDFLDSMKIILEGCNYRVLTMQSAEEGLKAYKQQKPDFVLVDLMMEEVDSGLHFMKEIRALGAIPPTFLLSSVGDNLNRNTDYTQIGFSGVLQKPINPDTLLKALSARLPKVK